MRKRPPAPNPNQSGLSRSTPSRNGSSGSLSTVTSLGKESPEASGEELCPPAVVQRGFHVNRNDQIGAGSFSKIYRASWDRIKDRFIACKWMDLNNVDPNWKENCLSKELKISKHMKHPNIVKVHDVIKTRTSVMIFMDLAAGSIAQKMSRQKSSFPERQVKVWMTQIISAMQYIHGKGIAHRDIKLDNFLLSDSNAALISDFGFASMAKNPREEMLKNTVCGSKPYMAPEVIRAGIGSSFYDPKKADIFSVGVCLFQMLNFSPPFSPKAADKELLILIGQKSFTFKDQVKNVLTARVKDLINRMLEPQPNARLTARQVASHPWMDPAFVVNDSNVLVTIP